MVGSSVTYPFWMHQRQKVRATESRRRTVLLAPGPVIQAVSWLSLISCSGVPAQWRSSCWTWLRADSWLPGFEYRVRNPSRTAWSSAVGG
jgi:hypothetical protein